MSVHPISGATRYEREQRAWKVRQRALTVLRACVIDWESDPPAIVFSPDLDTAEQTLITNLIANPDSSGLVGVTGGGAQGPAGPQGPSGPPGADGLGGVHPDLLTHLTLGLAAEHAHPYAATAHGHAQADVTSLTADLAGKAASGHAHGDGDLPAGLARDAEVAAAYSPLGHSHAGGGSTFVRKTADQTFSLTTFSDSTNLAFAIAASTTYRFRFVVFFTTNAATVGIKLGINGPAGATLRFGVIVPAAAMAGAGNAAIHGTGTTYNTETVAATAGPGATGSMAIVEGVLVNGVTPGTLQLRHGSETATATTILANSYGELTAI